MISVIVPVYNVENYLEKCLQSIINQTNGNWELLLVDDGSTDSSGEICDRYSKNYDRIAVFHKNNGGVSSARNVGLQHAKGDYVIFIDGDDWIEPTLFEDSLKAMETNDADAFMFEYFIDSKNELIIHTVNNDYYGVIDKKQAIQYSIDSVNRFAWSKIFKKELSNNVWFDKDIILGEDTLYICSVLANANKVVYSNKPYYHYIIREGSAVNSVFNRKKLSGMAAYQGVVDLCNELGYGDVALVAKKSVAELAIQLAKIICSTPEYSEKKDDLKYLKSIIMQCKKDISNTSILDLKMRIKLLLTAINIRLLRFI